MKTDKGSFPLISRVLVATTLLLVSLVALLSYSLLARGQTICLQDSSSKKFQLAQLVADVRTVAAAISYLLEPEPSVRPNSPFGPNVEKRTQILVGQAARSPMSNSNQQAFLLTNRVSRG
jgi:hypothetical protein